MSGVPRTSTTTREGLEETRARQDADALAAALSEHADALVNEGRLALAIDALDEAGALHQTAGRTADSARCLHLAATLARAEGDLGGSQRRAERALELAEPGTRAAVSAATELAETAATMERHDDAVEWYGRALDDGIAAGLNQDSQAVLLTRAARQLAAAGDNGGAAQAAAVAARLFGEAGNTSSARRALVEQATALERDGERTTAAETRRRAREEAHEAADHRCLADLALLGAAQALARGDVGGAYAEAAAARAHALEGVEPSAYLAAAAAMSELAEADGDDVAAYGALATAWVTLGDLLGRQPARAAVGPRLERLLERWGRERFSAAKRRYEACSRGS